MASSSEAGISNDARLSPALTGGGNLASSLDLAAERWPERVALTFDGSSISVGDLSEGSSQAAGALRRHGVGPGDRVAIGLPNVPAFPFFYFGALRLGATVVPVNPQLKAEEIAFTLDDAGVRAHVAWHESERPGSDSGEGAARLTVEEPLAASLLAGVEPVSATAEVDPESTAVILYTSGTTGRPKGAELTHRNLGLNTAAAISTFELGRDDVLLGALPLYHSFGQTLTLNASIAVGARLALVERFDADAALATMAKEGVTVLMGVPTMLFSLVGAAAGDGTAFASLRACVSGGAPLPLEQLKAFESVAGLTVLESYGLSETSPAATLHRVGTNRVGSVGKPIDGVEVQVVDDGMREVPIGETGQIVIRGHNVMKGYWRRPEATAAAITPEGWFLTGDLGRVDEDGYVYVVGRLKDMILRGGRNVYPREVEEVLHRHPAVSEAAVVGVPDERLGEEVAAAVVPAAGASVEPDELRQWIRERIAPYKYPRRIWVVAELPKGPTGKILKREIAPPEVER